MENEHGPCALADDEVALPMAGLGSGVDSLRPFMDGDPIFDRISRGPDQKLRTFVCDRLAEGWTPEQIAGWLKAGNERRLRAVGCNKAILKIGRPTLVVPDRVTSLRAEHVVIG